MHAHHCALLLDKQQHSLQQCLICTDYIGLSMLHSVEAC